jgi:polar amino acid transport system substrate-binding protein
MAAANDPTNLKEMSIMLRNLKCAFLAMLMIAPFVGSALAGDARCEPEKVATKYPGYADKTVKIAASPTQPPYASTDPKDPNRLTGLEVEMIEGVMKCAGLKYEFVKGAWAGLLQAMFSGSADVMIGQINYRKDRAEKVDFVLYDRAGGTAVVQKGNPKKIVNVASLCGATGSATVGGSSALLIDRQSKACVAQGKPAIDFQPATDADAAYRQVEGGRNDFAMDDAGSAAVRLVSDPGLELGFTITTDLVGGFVVAKGNSQILQAVSEGLEVQEKNGSLAALMKKYGLDPALLMPIEVRQ